MELIQNVTNDIKLYNKLEWACLNDDWRVLIKCTFLLEENEEVRIYVMLIPCPPGALECTPDDLHTHAQPETIEISPREKMSEFNTARMSWNSKMKETMEYYSICDNIILQWNDWKVIIHEIFDRENALCTEYSWRRIGRIWNVFIALINFETTNTK